MAINLPLPAIDVASNLLRLSRITLLLVLVLPFRSSAMSRDTIKYSLELDKSVRMGHLSNGFTYYLKPTNGTDEISLRLLIKVGFYNERLPEFHFAHLIEHIAANQIDQHINSGIVDSEEKFVPNTSAETGHVFTQYHGTFPGKDIKTLLSRLQGYANISKLSMEEDLIRHEARCVRQELFIRSKSISLNKSFNETVYKSAIFFGKEGKSPYTNWLTSYDMGGICVPSVREFYHRWYRIDRMGLIVTGNIQNIDKLEDSIISIYSTIPKSTMKNDLFDFRPLYLSNPPRFKVVEHIEINRFSNWNEMNSETSLFFRVKNFNKQLDTEEKWIREKIYKAMYTMIYKRLRENGVPSWPTQNGIAIDADFPDRNYPYFRIPAIINVPGTERENLQRVTSILKEVHENGFTQKEWNNEKRWMLNKIKSQDTARNQYWNKQLENHFVYGELLPEDKKAITLQWIDNISLEDINSFLKDNFSVMPDDIYIRASSGHPALSFTEKQVRGWIKEAVESPIELKGTINSLVPIAERNTPLMNPHEVKNLKEVEYIKKRVEPDNGLELLKLVNGVKIILDQQEPKSNGSESITIRGSSWKGASCLQEEDYYAALSATEIVKLSGAGGFDRKTILDKFGRKFLLNSEPVQLHIQNNKSTIYTCSKLENLEKHLQLIYLYFTSPRKDSIAFKQWKIQIQKRYFEGNSPVNPRTDLKNSIANFLNLPFLKAPMNLVSTEQFYQKQNVKLEKAYECYQAIFGNASDFTFVIKGMYEKDKVLPLLQKYLGNLPTNEIISCTKLYTTDKNELKSPIGPVQHTFYANKMKTGYKLYTIWYNLSYVFPMVETKGEDRFVLDFINLYLYSKVKYLLRHEKGIATYGALTEGSYSETDNLYSLAIYVDGLEDELEKIKYECKAIIDDLKNNGISLEAKNRILSNPLYRGKYISTRKLHQKVNQYIKSLSVENIKAIATKYLKEENQYEFIFMENNENTLKY